MALAIRDEVLAAAHLTELELRREVALTLFQQERLTLARASKLAGGRTCEPCGRWAGFEEAP